MLVVCTRQTLVGITCHEEVMYVSKCRAQLCDFFLHVIVKHSLVYEL